MTATKKTVEMPKPPSLHKQITGNISSAKTIASAKAQDDVAAAISRTAPVVAEDKGKPPVVLTVRGNQSRTGYKNVSFQMELEHIEALDAFLGKGRNKGAAINHAIALMMAGYLERFNKDGVGLVADIETGIKGVHNDELEAYHAQVKAYAKAKKS